MARRIAVTLGEPAGIGPDVAIQAFQQPRNAAAVVLADPHLLAARAKRLGLPLVIDAVDTCAAGRMTVLPHATAASVTPGRLDARNGRYVLDTLERGVAGCLNGEFDALVTAPVQKSVLNEAGIAFTGHTGFLRDACGVEEVLMLLAAGPLRVALVTDHAPLRAVPGLVTQARVDRALRLLVDGLRDVFGVASPRVAVAGLNPHAGEGGWLGREEIDVIEPVCAAWRAAGANVVGPLSADTIFNRRGQDDAVLAMYHDQGLPAFKQASFGNAVNITLGLPFLRASVDHGTALDLAGSGCANAGSFRAAFELACGSAGEGAA